jgi:cell division protein ZapB
VAGAAPAGSAAPRAIFRGAAPAVSLTDAGAAPIVGRMNDTARNAFESELRKLEKRVDELMVTVSQLKEENRALRQRQESLTAERSALLQKNEQVRARVEAMIGRLKSMEHGT